jgi:NTE family protein
MKHTKTIDLTVCLVLAIFFYGVPFASAQTTTTVGKKRPKIGLVLGGGGARGAAHVGVLKVLEANHVPIDYIAGTSMGAIVGGLYAAGYSPDELEKIFNQIDWIDMLSDRPTEDLKSFRHKKDYQQLTNAEMGIKDGKITFRRGAVPGQKLDFMLSKLTIHTIDTPSFDQLRIPFRAVATDALTGQRVVFDKGNLAKAIRASMSVPGAFPPVKYEGKLLIDGFLVQNVPVEIVKEMGADIIIVVDVGGSLMKEEQLKTLLDMTNQMIGILSQKNIDESLALLTDKDLLIKPDLEGIGPGDFVKTPEAIKRGEQTALKAVEGIKRFSASDDDFQAFVTHQRVRESAPIKLDFVTVSKQKWVNEEIIKGRIKTKPGQTLDFDQLNRDLTNIYAIGDFETVGFNVENKDDKKALVIDAHEKPWGPQYLRFGFDLESDISGNNNYSILLDYRHTQLNSLGGEWKVVGSLGQTTGIYTDFYQPLDIQNFFFIDPQFKYDQTFQDVFQGDDKIAEYRRNELGAGIDIGANLKSYLEARVGLRTGLLDAQPEVGSRIDELTSIQGRQNRRRIGTNRF